MGRKMLSPAADTPDPISPTSKSRRRRVITLPDYLLAGLPLGVFASAGAILSI